MRYIFLMLKLLLLFVSNLGYWNYIGKKTKINIYYCPAVTIAGQIFVLFIAGIWNLLPEAANGIYILGIILFAMDLYKKRWKEYSAYKNWGYFYLAICLILSAIALRGCLFNDYDNFSHWATVVDEMLRTNRYPNFQSKTIMFQAYPLGSATYIYYFTKMIDPAESAQMLAQVYMMLACILPVFSFVTKHHFFISVYTVFMTNLFFVMNIRIDDLLVDTLLPLFGTMMLVFAYCECHQKGCNLEEITPREHSLRMLCLSFLLVSTMLIKNSGVYFVGFAFVILYKIYKANKQDRVVKRNVILCASMPIVAWLLWKKHCEYVFISAETSKHAMSIAGYIKEFLNKDWSAIQTITKQMVEFFFTGKDLRIVVLSLIALGVLTFVLYPDNMKRYCKVLSISVATYTLYMIGMLGMYLVSMSGGEALHLAGNIRYRRTILIAILYFLTIYFIQLLCNAKNTREFAIEYVALGIILVCCWQSNYKGITIFQVNQAGADRRWMETQIADYNIPQGQSYAICIDSEDAGYMYYMGKYVFASEKVNTPVITAENQTEMLNDYQYVIVADQENEILQNWVLKEYPEQAGCTVIRTRGEN